MTDFADLSRERVQDDLHGDEYRRRALERADRLREVSDLPEMGLPFVSIERVQPDPGLRWWQWLLLLAAVATSAIVIGAGLAFWLVPA